MSKHALPSKRSHSIFDVIQPNSQKKQEEIDLEHEQEAGREEELTFGDRLKNFLYVTRFTGS